MYLNNQQSQGGVVTSDMLQSTPPPAAAFEGEITGVGNTLGQRQFVPGEELIMIWRFRNVGLHSWPATELVCADGDSLGLQSGSASIVNLGPGCHVDLPVNLRAPFATGSVGGAFRLRSELHGYITEPSWVFIEVAGDVGIQTMPESGTGVGEVGGDGMAMDDDL